MNDIIHITQPGKLEGNKVRIGEMVAVPLDPEKPEGPHKLALKLGRVCLKLGNGLEVSEEQTQPGAVVLAVTAAAAKRLGWAHPANKPAPSAADLGRLRGIVGNQGYGQQEQIEAINQIAAIDPALAQQLALSNQWLFDGR